MEVIIKKASSDDAFELLKYIKQIGGETDNLSFGSEGLSISLESEKKYLSQIEDSQDTVMFLAKENGKIIGNASLGRLPRRMCHRGEVSVTVLKEYWNRGIGNRLLLEIIDFAKKNAFKVLDLEVRSDNLPAIHLYKKHGFEKIGNHPSFFKVKNEDISVDYMCLRIQ